MQLVDRRFKTIGSDSAEKLLEHVDPEYQRDLGEFHVNHLRGLIDRGEFLLGHIVLAQFPCGRKAVANGMHTAKALTGTNNTIDVVKEVYAVDDEHDYWRLFGCYDTESRLRSYRQLVGILVKTHSDTLGSSPQELLNGVRTALPYAQAYAAGKAQVGRTPGNTRGDSVNALLGQIDLLRFLATLHAVEMSTAAKRQLLMRPQVLACIINSRRKSPGDAATFWMDVMTGSHPDGVDGQRHPPWKLHTWLKEVRIYGKAGQMVDRIAVYNACASCWNRFREKQLVTQITTKIVGPRRVIMLS